MNYKILHLLYAIVASLVLWSCGDDGPDPVPGPDPVEPADECARTVLVYQVANRNGLASNSMADLAEMKEAVADGHTGADGRLLVYNHRSGNAPVLLEVRAAGFDTLRIYDTDLSSVNPQRMKDVFADMEHLRPARSYGLILWGHGTGWLQDGRETGSDRLRSYGGDNGEWMNITTLADVLTSSTAFDYLYFDCCYMASAEVAYEIGTAVPRMAASVIEIASEGMPYDRTLRYFFDKGDDALAKAAGATVDYYREWQNIGSRPECTPSAFAGRYCAMSVINTAAMADVADAARSIVEAAPALYSPDMTLMRYGRDKFRTYYFDLAGYMRQLCYDATGNERFAGAADSLARFDAALAAAVEFNDNMGRVFASPDLSIEKSSGLSCFVPRSSDDVSDKNSYNTLRWFTDVVKPFYDR